MTLKSHVKFVENSLIVWKIASGFWQIFTRVFKNLKNLHFNEMLWPKYKMFELKKYRWLMLDGTEYWCKIWRKIDLCFQKWHEEFGKFSPEHVQKSKNLDFYWVLLSKVENVWTWNLQESYVSWQWKIMHNLNRNKLVSSKLTRGI